MTPKTIPWLAPLLLAACAHLERAPAPKEPAPVWPAPPYEAQVRWEASFPDPARLPRASFLQRALRYVIGLDPEPQRKEAPLLSRPFGLAASGDEVFVADPDGPKVLAVDWRASTSRELRCDAAPWVVPMAVAASADGAVYVADGGAREVVRISRSGACSVLGAGTLERPTGVAVSGDRVYVVDPPRHAVVVYRPDGFEVARFGGKGAGEGELYFPTAIAVAPGGDLLVVDALNFRVSRFDRHGRFLSSFGAPGAGGGAFGRPKGVAVDAEGRIFVSDELFDVVLRFSRDGEYELALGGGGAKAGELLLPAGVAVAEDRLFVADSFNHRVQVYELLRGAP